MLNLLFSRFGLAELYRRAYDREQVRSLLLVALLALIVWGVWVATSSAPVLAVGGPRALVSFLVPVGVIGVIVAVRRTRLDIAAVLIVAILIDLVAPHVLWQFYAQQPLLSATILLLIPLIGAIVLLDRPGVILTGIALLVMVALRAYLQSSIDTPILLVPSAPAATDLVLLALVVLAALIFPLLFGGSGGRALNAARVQIDRLRDITGYVSVAEEAGDTSALLRLTAELVRRNLGYAVVQFYLVDVDGGLTRRLRSGPEAAISDEVTRPSSGEAAALADAISRRRFVTYTLGVAPAGYLISPAAGAVILPIFKKGAVIGAMDVQSVNRVFTDNELADLILVADELGGAFARQDMLNDLRRIITEQDQISASLRAQVASLRRTEEGSVMQQWLHYFEGRGQAAFGFDLPPGAPVDMPVVASGLPDTMASALAQSEVAVETVGDEQVINVPIMFRGQTLGAMSFAVPRGRALTRQQLEMAQTIGNRLGLALDNTRLFEQTQAQALRERRVGEIGSLLIGATDVQSVLNLAASNFNEALGAVFTRIYIQPAFVAEPVSGEETT